MKHVGAVFAKHRSRTLRLAATYLAIIMSLTMVFSVVIYQSLADPLQIQVRHSPMSEQAQQYDIPTGLMLRGEYSAADVEDLNSFLQDRVSAVRDELLRRLLLLNSAALILGACLSYYLARRTLRPIEAAFDAQSRFTSDASHELRTPLAAMQAENEAALHQPNVSPAMTNLIKSNLEEIERLSTLSDGLLRLARQDEVLQLSPVWVDRAAASAIRRVSHAARVKQIHITNTWPHIVAQADEYALVHIITILLDNAIKYSPRHAIVHLDSSRRDGVLALYVRDSGRGIAEDDLPHIFERFYRARQTKTSVQGHGLGLSIAQKLAHQMHGRITTTSRENEGSTFAIILPLHKH